MDEVMFWHFCLGHPNFVYLEKMFPQLFIIKIQVLFIVKSVSLLNIDEQIVLQFLSYLLVHSP